MLKKFRLKLMVIMIAFAVSLSFVIFHIHFNKFQNKMLDEGKEKLSLIVDNILISLKSVDNALFLFDKEIYKNMKANTDILINKYKENPNFSTWDFEQLSNDFSMDIYILDESNKIIYSNNAESMSIDFDECCKEFSDLTHKRRESGSFFHDGLEVHIKTGDIAKFSYQSTPDKKYIIELGVFLSNHEIFQKFNFLNVIERLEKEHSVIDDINVFTDEGYRIGRNEEEGIKISSEYMNYVLDALKTKEKIYVNNDGTGMLFVPYQADDLRGDSTDRVIQIMYNKAYLDKTLKDLQYTFLIQMFIIISLSILASVLITYMVSKPMYLAFHDVLTGMQNRVSFSNHIEKLLKSNSKMGMLLLDLDNFKQVNDKLGHDTGDMLLKYFSKTLNNILPKNAVPFRLGGDEFVILISDLKDKEELEVIANSIVTNISGVNKEDVSFNNNDKHMRDVILLMDVSVSIGGIISPDYGKDTVELYKSVDKALYFAKEKGKNQYAFYGDILN